MLSCFCLCLFYRYDQRFRTVTADVLHFDVQLFSFHAKRSTIFRNAAERTQHITAERIVCFGSQMDIQCFLHIVDWRAAKNSPTVFRELCDLAWLLRLSLFKQLPNQQLHKIMHGRDAAHAAVFINRYSEMYAAGLHLPA